MISIPYNMNEEQRDDLFNKINGFLMPGGDASLWKNFTKKDKFSQ